jgi:hypothetical protein
MLNRLLRPSTRSLTRTSLGTWQLD